MTRIPLFLALTLALAACSGESTAPTDAGASTDSTPSTGAGDSPSAPVDSPSGGSIADAVAGSWRDDGFRSRDAYRNPAETLAFFGVEPDDRVVEITPGGGWYAEILAPLVSGEGRYHGAVADPATATSDERREGMTRQNQALRDKFAAQPDVYGDAALVEFDPAEPRFGEPGSADVVLTFRNVHNWRMGGTAAGMFEGFYEVLAPGGVLGVVEHRAAGDVPDTDRSGYVGQDQVIALAEAAGFELDASSEINANPRDTRDHPNGVWTLPPSNRHDEADAEKYAAIGESDRMTLRFRKPTE